MLVAGIALAMFASFMCGAAVSHVIFGNGEPLGVRLQRRYDWWRQGRALRRALAEDDRIVRQINGE